MSRGRLSRGAVVHLAFSVIAVLPLGIYAIAVRSAATASDVSDADRNAVVAIYGVYFGSILIVLTVVALLVGNLPIAAVRAVLRGRRGRRN